MKAPRPTRPTVPVLDPGRGKTKTGRLWTAVRDERPFGSAVPPASFYRYSPDRKAEQARALLAAVAASCTPTVTRLRQSLLSRTEDRRSPPDRSPLGACPAQDLRCACRDRLPRRARGA